MNCMSEAQNHCGLGVSETRGTGLGETRDRETRGTGLGETRDKPGGQVSCKPWGQTPVNHGDRPQGRVVFTYVFFELQYMLRKLNYVFC